MTRNRSHGFFGTTAGAAAISACLVLVLFGSRPTNAGSGARQKHAAVSRDVAIDGQLAQEGEGWVIKLKAVNSGAKAQQCNVAAALTSVRSNMMSRAMPTPKTLWKSTVVVNVPASGASDEQTLQVPAGRFIVRGNHSLFQDTFYLWAVPSLDSDIVGRDD